MARETNVVVHYLEEYKAGAPGRTTRLRSLQPHLLSVRHPMEGQYLIQPRKDDAHDFDSAYYATDVTSTPGTQPPVRTVHDSTFAQPMYHVAGYAGANTEDHLFFPTYGYDQLAAQSAGAIGDQLAYAPFIAPLPGYGTINAQLHLPPYNFALYNHWPSIAGESSWVLRPQSVFCGGARHEWRRENADCVSVKRKPRLFSSSLSHRSPQTQFRARPELSVCAFSILLAN